MTTYSLDQAVTTFLEAKHASGASPKTIRDYSEVLGRFQGFSGHVTLQRMTPALLRRYLSHLQQDVSPNSVASYYRIIRAFLRWCASQGYIKSSPTDRVEAPREVRRVVRPFTPEEVREMMEYLGHNPDAFLATRNVALLLLLLDTGLRISEALALGRSSLNESGIVKVIGKGSKERYVRLSPQVLVSMGAYMTERDQLPARKRCPALFTTWDGRPLAPQGFRTVMSEMAKDLVWDHVRVSPHTLRNTYGCWTAIAGMDTESIRVSMGHSTQAMTARYIEYAAQRRAILEHQRYSPARLLEDRVALGMEVGPTDPVVATAALSGHPGASAEISAVEEG